MVAGRAGGEKVPGAVSVPVAALVTGPLTPATVLGVHAAAVLLSIDPAPAGKPGREAGGFNSGREAGGFNTVMTVPRARVISVLAREASGVPNGVRTALSAADRPFAAIPVHGPALVGAGRVELPGLTVRAVRTIRTAVPRLSISPARAAELSDQLTAALTDQPRGVPGEPVAALGAALASGSAEAVRGAVRALVGLGTGSTPGGDDVLAGTMAALRAVGRDVLADQIAAAALPDCAERTPLLSADLLHLAAAGQVCAEAGALLRAANTHRGTVINSALAALTAIGHTSGADLATGIALGLGVPAQPEPRRPRRHARTSTV